MKKVGIITITGLGNYGNRLQNYALQQVIEKITPCCCETLINKSCRLKGYIKKIIMPRKGKLSQREQIFQQFNEEFVHFSDIKINNITKNHRLQEFDCLVCGSDQIWNSDYPENDKAMMRGYVEVIRFGILIILQLRVMHFYNLHQKAGELHFLQV